MTMRFPYQFIALSRPVLPLGGRMGRPRPVVAISVVGPTGTWLAEGLLDSGADDVVFPEDVALRTGIDLTNAQTGGGPGATLASVPLRYARVGLRLTDGTEFHEWEAWVGFTAAKMYRPMLGFAGCLQFFDTNLRGALEVAELTVNSIYPGT
jgi:hypothetical protein